MLNIATIKLTNVSVKCLISTIFKMADRTVYTTETVQNNKKINL